MKYRPADEHDIAAVTEVHLAAFPGFFLTSLGTRFLGEMYRGFLLHPSGILLVAEEAGKVMGFAAGTSAPASFFSELRRQRFLSFFCYAIPALFRNPKVVFNKLLKAVFYRGDKPTGLEGGALLSSIGVSPNVVGKSVGQELLTRFEHEALLRGQSFVYLTTDEVGNDRVNAFYRKNGYVVESRFSQHAGRAMFRYVKYI
ncbi:GNAT family N-acetyltransferase [Pseudomonas benzenivorans]|uniref:GNAT family N-acetyltransferase n=1 Tax=Pseudomonas benzenivorans TaxID=556533 RepID=A0ABZ0PZY6_9PSED|nr:GNAT family N-acetyltransferase [Pseudomonas benzenivorans]WPC06780.1 GNAT family N-acetyltransferase [Pseudomonas benzenivorans]